jgi:hypothetical protein
MLPRQSLGTAQERRVVSPLAFAVVWASALLVSLLAWIGLILASIALL